ncbi:tRNA (adenosine(37)-N6)-threonylcarbamoyltransferase complex ATPase subunit type 1 TsaE [Streptococcus catagoni]|uniref:tRNA (adenosine(37)-N6)-threonylcarbamoyltransferase complex ATPase subunit type 1 TsaE n=1 Tax=Streptococcus catagoni TaxID=2654874 RepID=UPI00140E2089|nr:tRNA (adenosine(37)-N6)-threonylcarbamoyltransferase complex ATPase subunit type 1 TsaE [Streptococcus catagoni]
MFYRMNGMSEDQVIKFGYHLGQKLQKKTIITLSGDLGAGKTTLTKGIAKGLGVSQMVKSPTYTIVREYEGRLPLYHLDVYRIGDDPDSIDLDDFIFGDGVTVIEWGDLLDQSLLDDYLQIRLKKNGLVRDLELEAHGKASEKIIEGLKDV